MYLDVILIVALYMGGGALFGFTLFSLMYLNIERFRTELKGKSIFLAIVFSLIGAGAFAPYVSSQVWYLNFKAVQSQLEVDKSCSMPVSFVDDNGYSVGAWGLDMYRGYLSGELTGEQRGAVERIGLVSSCKENGEFI